MHRPARRKVGKTRLLADCQTGSCLAESSGRACKGKNSKLSSSNFFIERTYKQAGNGKEVKRYDITKMGCEMVANKLTGQKGIMFTAKYVELFNKMAEQIIEERTDSYMITDPVKRAKKWIEEEKNVRSYVPRTR